MEDKAPVAEPPERTFEGQQGSWTPQRSHPEPPSSKWVKFGTLGAIAFFLFGKLKILLPAIKFLKLGKILTTASTMLLSMWAYAVMFGWSFGVGVVLLIFIHEMGHVYVAWRQGMPVSAPVFIPFMGAVILQRGESKTAWAQAAIGIGGPVGGAIGAVICHLIFLQTQHPLFLGLAYFGYFMNLLNLTPVVPLDGGWITGAISPWLWLVGLVGLTAMFITGTWNNPFVIIIVLMSLPRLWHGLRHRGAPPGGQPATGSQKLKMGAYYLALAGFLAWGMAYTHEDPRALRPPAQPDEIVQPVS